MKREAKVVRENGRLMAEVLREEACQSCRACRFGQVERVLVELPQGSEYREGETIELEVPDGTVSRGALLSLRAAVSRHARGAVSEATRWGAEGVQALGALVGLALGRLSRSRLFSRRMKRPRPCPAQSFQRRIKMDASFQKPPCAFWKLALFLAWEANRVGIYLIRSY